MTVCRQHLLLAAIVVLVLGGSLSATSLFLDLRSRTDALVEQCAAAKVAAGDTIGQEDALAQLGRAARLNQIPAGAAERRARAEKRARVDCQHRYPRPSLLPFLTR